MQFELFYRKIIARRAFSVENSPRKVLRKNFQVFLMNRVEMRIIYTGNVRGWVSLDGQACFLRFLKLSVLYESPRWLGRMLGQGKKSELEEFAQAIRDSGWTLNRDEKITWSQIYAAEEAQGHQKCYRGFDMLN
jgi:hypothetical protein